MKSQPLQRYFFFGTCVRYLQDATTGQGVGDNEMGWGLRTNLKQFFEYVDELNLHVTSRHTSFYRLQGILQELESPPNDSSLSATQAVSLRQEITSLRGTLEAELRGVAAYTLTPKRYDTALLLDNIGLLLSPGVYDKLPSIAQYDLREAGKCLAFERSTASAFHLLRATEAVLRVFYIVLVKRGRRHEMWGAIIIDLRRRPAAKKHAVLLDNLDNIRRSFRNPTQHPDATYDINELQDLWGLCTDAINRMARVLPDKAAYR